MNKLELELKSTGRSCEVKINGQNQRYVTGVSVNMVAGDFPVVNVTQDSDFHIKGFLVNELPKNLHCPKCSHLIGEFIGSYDVRCPVCDTDIIKE